MMIEIPLKRRGLVYCDECAYLSVQNTKYLYAICQRHGIEFKPFEDDTRTHYCAWGVKAEQTDLLVTEYPQDGEVNLIGRGKTEAVVMAYDVYKELTEPQIDCRRCKHYATGKCKECFGHELFTDSGYATDCSWR